MCVCVCPVNMSKKGRGPFQCPERKFGILTKNKYEEYNGDHLPPALPKHNHQPTPKKLSESNQTCLRLTPVLA